VLELEFKLLSWQLARYFRQTA